MTSALTGLVAALGLALVITAGTKSGTHGQAVIDAFGHAGGQLERAALGESGA